MRKLSKAHYWRFARATKTLSNRRRVLNFLAAGNSLTSAQAATKFGVKNFRAMISDIRSQVEAFGNWEIVSTVKNGKTIYSMEDTHEGDRTYAFKQDGTRYMVNA